MNQERIKDLVITYLQYIPLDRLARETKVSGPSIRNLLKGEKMSDQILEKIRQRLVAIGDELVEANIISGKK